MATNTHTNYIAITDADQPIWGVGETLEEARADALAYASSNLPEAIGAFEASLSVVPCTEALAALVAERGGAVCWELVNGTAYADREETCQFGDLIDINSGDVIRAASEGEARASQLAGEADGGVGAIPVEVEGAQRTCYVAP